MFPLPAPDDRGDELDDSPHLFDVGTYLMDGLGRDIVAVQPGHGGLELQGGKCLESFADRFAMAEKEACFFYRNPCPLAGSR